MLSEAPPCLLLVTTSLTCLELMDVNTLTSSGMIAPASVPQVMMVASFHHIVVSPPRPVPWPISRYDATYVRATETMEVSQTSIVRGGSKFILSALANLALAIASLMKYESAEATTMITRIAKIQTMSWTCTSALVTARRMKDISATTVTP